MSGRITPKSAAEWSAVAPQWLGVFGLLAQLVVWAATLAATGKGAVEPALLTAFGGLLVTGQGIDAIGRLGSGAKEPDSEGAK